MTGIGEDWRPPVPTRLPYHRDSIDALLDECCTALIAARARIGAPYMNKLVEAVLSSYGKDVSFARERVSHYLDLLASAGKTEEQLLAFGIEYLKEILEPDSRYSGC